MTEKLLLKDLLFSPDKVEQIASEIRRAHRSFKADVFVLDVLAKFPELELKARISWLAECLKHHLPDDYIKAVEILVKALPAPNNAELLDDDFGEFIYASYSAFVAKYGCTKEYLRISLGALYEITQRFSAEDAIRYFINTFPQETLKELLLWTKDQHYHVRRLCSEGTRPKLPWSQKVSIPATAPLAILTNLFCDKTRFVTRSVANHLNDISKIDADLVIATLTKWQQSGKQKPNEMDYIVRHSLRTLVKEGHPLAMKMLGYADAAPVAVSKVRVPKQVKMNTALEFSFSLDTPESANVVIDYIIYFQNKAGKLNNKKIFKLTKIVLEANKPFVVTKKHLLREHMTTRTLYRGEHLIEIQVNGKRLIRRPFLLQ